MNRSNAGVPAERRLARVEARIIMSQSLEVRRIDFQHIPCLNDPLFSVATSARLPQTEIASPRFLPAGDAPALVRSRRRARPLPQRDVDTGKALHGVTQADVAAATDACRRLLRRSCGVTDENAIPQRKALCMYRMEIY